MLICHSSGLDGITTYNIASPSKAAATERLVIVMGNGGNLNLLPDATG